MKHRAVIVLFVVVLLAVLPFPARPAHAGRNPQSALQSPDWKWISGPLVPGSHTHGAGLARIYHLYVRDGWSGAVYTCSVPRRIYDNARWAGWLNGYLCRHGRS